MNGIRVTAAAEDVGMCAARLDNVGRLVGDYVTSGRYAGALAVVARQDKVVHLGVHGHADVARDRPMRPDTIFRIYSMTKPIVSVALMTLYEQGRFQLDDPVSKFIPSWGEMLVCTGGTPDDYVTRAPARPMTVRDLLMHTSGLAGRSADSPVAELYRRVGVADLEGAAGNLAGMVERLATIPLAADPGSRWIYGISTDVVGRLCEIIGGRPLDEFLRERIFDPLSMVDTGFRVPETDRDRFAACYAFRDGSPAYELLDDPATSPFARPRTYFSGIAGLVSTAQDYLRFCRMLARGGELDGNRVLGTRTVGLMTCNHLPGGRDLASLTDNGGESTRFGQGFGLGFGVLLDQTVAQTMGTPGEFFWGGAASTAFFVSPDDDLVVLFLTQLRQSRKYPIRRELRSIVYSALTD
jgi:CubicO group peptidase (beta-lactamase class C family)